MGRQLICLVIAWVLGCGGASSAGVHTAPSSQHEATPAWQPWSPEAFARARKERRLVLLSVQAGWCHWCHVMDATTYRDAEVVALLRERFVTVRPQVKLSVVGPGDDPRTVALHRAALSVFLPNGLVVHEEPAESHYPYDGEPALYLCSNDACSSPVTRPEQVAGALREFAGES